MAQSCVTTRVGGNTIMTHRKINTHTCYYGGGVLSVCVLCVYIIDDYLVEMHNCRERPILVDGLRGCATSIGGGGGGGCGIIIISFTFRGTFTLPSPRP